MRPVAVTLALAGVAISACTSGSSAPIAGPTTTSPQATASASSSPAAQPDRPAPGWPTYHGSNDRSGFADVAALTPPLRRAWARPLDGAVYAQPIVVGGRAIVATENNSVYAIRPGSGTVLWRRHLAPPVPRSALPCGNIDPTGITGTPAYDADSGLVFVVTETTGSRHDLRALDPRTGRERWRRNLDVLPGRDPRAEQQRAALLVTHGRVYVSFGGRAGDCGNYVGYVAAVATDGHGRALTYAVPTAREAGMWAPPGPVQDETRTDIYVASGNGAEVGNRFDGSDSVIRLTPTLRRVAFFAPSTWAEDNAADLDLGSSSPVPVPTGQIVIAGKRGRVYLLDADLGGIGGERAHLDGCRAFGGAAFVGRLVVLPCDGGIRRLDVGPGTLRWDWQVPGVAGSPVIARDGVYSFDLDTGELVEVSLRTGDVRARVDVGPVSRFATPAPTGDVVLVGTMSGVVAVRGR